MTIEEKIATLPKGFEFVNLQWPLRADHTFWAYVYPPSGKNWRVLVGCGTTAAAAVDDVLNKARNHVP